MAVRKDWPVLRNLIDKIFAAMPASEHEAIKNRWIAIAEKKIEPGRSKIALTAQESAWLEMHPVIRVHNEKDWPPFNYFEYGRPRGLSIDYMDLVADKLGLTVEYVTGPSWNEFLGMVKRKDLDVMLNIVKTEDRLKYLLYTEPYIRNPNVIVSSPENPYETIDALAGKTVAFPKGFFYEEVLTKSFPRINRLPVEDTLASLKAVGFGRADAALGEAAVMRTLINKNLLSGLQISGEVNIGDPDLTNLRLGVRDDWPLLQSALTKAMAAITPQQMNQIRQKWLVTDMALAAGPAAGPISYSRLIWYGLAVFLILCLLAWILIKTIRKENIVVNFGSRWFRGLVLAGLSVFIVVVCLLGWFTLEQNRAAVVEGISENLTETLKTANNRLNLWVAQRTSFLKLLGRDPELVSLTKRLLAVAPEPETLRTAAAPQGVRTFFENKKDLFSNSAFFIVNTENVTIGALQDTALGIRDFISVDNPELFRRAFKGDVLFLPSIPSHDAAVEKTRANRAGGPLTEFFVGPIFDPNGQILALMALGVNAAEDFSRVLSSSETRRTGETYAFNGRGQMLSESRFGEELRRIGLLAEDQNSAFHIDIRDPGVNLVAGQHPKIERSQQPLTRMASRAIQLKRDMEKSDQAYGHSNIEIDTNGYRDYRGVPVFGAWLWNAELGFGLATEIDVNEAMSAYRKIRRTVFGVLGFTMVLSVGAVLLVLLLGERASQALMKARDNLEEKVDERTAELQDKQRQLETAVERSRLLLDSAGEGIFGVDPEGKLAFINPAANRILGYDPDDLIGQQIHEIIHHSHASGSRYPKEDCPMYRSYTDGTDHHVTDEVLWRKDGTPLPVEYTSMPIKQHGRVVGAVITFMDIAERKKMETALRAERERLQKILDTSPVGVGISVGGIVRFANPRFAELFYSKEGDDAKHSYVNPQDRHYIVTELERSGIVRDYELQTYGPQREIRDILATFIRTEYEGQTGILAWMVDISGPKAAEKELKAKFDELARFRRLAIGREIKMIELKKEINALLKESGHADKYNTNLQRKIE
jgi:PAS domain S-box-containing protein